MEYNIQILIIISMNIEQKLLIKANCFIPLKVLHIFRFSKTSVSYSPFSFPFIVVLVITASRSVTPSYHLF